MRLVWIALLCLSGCWYITDAEERARMDLDADGVVRPDDCDDDDDRVGAAIAWYPDADGDGYGAGDAEVGCQPPAEEGWSDRGDDCKDDDPTIHPDAVEICNQRDDDCDGVDDEGGEPVTWWYDGDLDGYGDPAQDLLTCDIPNGYVLAGSDEDGDCDDDDPEINPGAIEYCDGIDNDCDDLIDTLDPDAQDRTWYRDLDNDGYGTTDTAYVACVGPGGYVLADGDCDDLDRWVNPGALEECDGIDNDCDGALDDDDDDVDAPEYYEDADADGFGGDDTGERRCMPLDDGRILTGGDCDDGDPAINPDADEICNEVDDDCDGRVDDDDPDLVRAPAWYADADADGYGDPDSVAVRSCVAVEERVDDATDCDDTDPDINVAADEECDGIDNNCDGTVDEDSAIDADTWYRDADHDGYGDPDTSTAACDEPEGYVDDDTDCDDTDVLSYPGALEYCDDEDNDCDGDVDEEENDITWYLDDDGDGYGDASTTLVQCEQPSGYVGTGDDCDDTDADINPDAEEVCDGIDNDCDGDTDADDSSVADASTYYADDDGDGFGDKADAVIACEQPSGYVSSASDCDDTDADINPTADEVCDGADNDCDGKTDDADSGLTDGSSWYADDDGDGYGDPGIVVTACTAPTGYVADPSDCDDSDADVSPDADEECDEIDNDCDGDIDESDAIDAVDWYTDADGDGFGDGSESATPACDAPAGMVANGADCDDSDPYTYPLATDICSDGIDNDCNGVVDDGTATVTWYYDDDGDGYGDASITKTQCAQPSGYVRSDDDCDDTDADINPGATEVCNGDDDDCDGDTDDDDSDVADPETWYADADEDGYGDASSTTEACTQPSGYVADDTDCDDTDDTLGPEVDWYLDDDGDGYGDATVSITDCTQPTGYVDDDTDCDDSDPDTWPGATEECNETDNDCDGTADDGVTYVDWYEDDDDDGYGDDSGTATNDCAQPSGYVDNNDDCDDTDPDINPDATEVCNEVDDDCDGDVDTDDSDLVPDWFYLDDDEDGYGDAASTATGCTAPSGYVDNDEDCDDTDADVNPDATEVCADGVDNDCDGDATPCIGFSGSLDTGDATAALYGANIGDWSGIVARIGDVDGDGNDDLAIGSPAAGTGNPGRLDVWLGGGSASASITGGELSLAGDSAGDRFGWAVAGGLDLDDDGTPDFAVGAVGDGTGGAAAGIVYVMSGDTDLSSISSYSDFESEVLASLVGEDAADEAGTSVDLIGDFDDDGTYGDVVVGAPGDDSNAVDAGAAYVAVGAFSGSTDLSGAEAKLQGMSADDGAGASVAGAGDVDGDGVPDVIVGAPGHDTSATDAGAAYIVLGTASGTIDLDDADVILQGATTGDLAGSTLASVGDWDDDGYADVAVGAPDESTSGAAAGAVYIVLDPTTASSDLDSADVVALGANAGDSAGASIAGADFDQDGYGDVAIGATDHDQAATNAGVIFLVRGDTTGTLDLDTDADAIIAGGAARDGLGSSAAAGDWDGDGYPDLVGAASRDDGGARDAGAVYIWLSSGGL